MTRGVQVIAAREGDELVGFAQLERSDGGAEISQVYVRPEHRGSGRGTAMTRAAIEAAGDVDDLWIVADDEGRPEGALRAARLSAGLDLDRVPARRPGSPATTG